MLLLLGSSAHAWAADTSVSLSDGTEISYQHYPAQGQTLFLWLYSEAGAQPIEDSLVKQLAQRGIEVWRLDLFEARFLPIAASSMDQIPDKDFAELIELAHQRSGKQIIPVTTGRGAMPVLRGARQWQIDHPHSKALQGVILMSPKFFVETPDPGVEGELMPIVKATNLPLFVMQPAKSPWYWKLEQTIPALEQNGSDVFVQRIANARDRFYFRPDAEAHEKQLTQQLPRMLKIAAQYLNRLPYQARSAVKSKAAEPEVRIGRKERELKVYQGDPTPPALRLADMQDKMIDLKDLRGNVVLVNFWASWCPPCVHEMPSMQRLQDQFKNQPFTILGVNMVEDKATIQNFLDTKVKVDFPIVLDSDGAALKRWGVFAFPTSYVIDKQGKIRYALFGGVEWDQAEYVEKIRALVNE